MVRLSKMTWQLKVLVVAVEILRVSVYFKIGFQKLFMVIQEPDVSPSRCCHYLRVFQGEIKLIFFSF